MHALLLAAAALLPQKDQVDEPLPAYVDARELESRLRKAALEHPALLRVETYGSSRAGRPLLVATLGNERKGDLVARPALLLVANLDGQHLLSSAVALAHIELLAAAYGVDETVTRLLDRTTIYIVPRANPDGAESYFATAARREMTGSITPVDDDRDGRTDEDPPEDLNGDGMITMMRWKDAKGTYVIDADEPRLMRLADSLKGERGVYRLAAEGLDSDQDDELNEDDSGGVALDRNFPHDFKEWDPRAGRFQLSEGESRALADFVLNHLNIALTLVYGVHDNLVSTPEPERGGGDEQTFGSGFRFFRQPLKGLMPDDQTIVKELGERYRKTTKSEAQGEKAWDGAFCAWSYFEVGVPTLACRLWAPSGPAKSAEKPPEKKAGDAGGAKSDEPQAQEAEKPAEPARPLAGEPPERARRALGARGGEAPPGTTRKNDESLENDKKLLAWSDAHQGKAFVAWQSYHHPTLGEVEIGGFAPFARQNPPAEDVASIATAHQQFLVDLLQLFARLRIESATAKSHGDGVSTIEASVVNDGFLPTSSAIGERMRRGPAARVVLDAGNAQILIGEKSVPLPTLAGSGGRFEVKWVVRGQHAGKLRVSVTSTQSGQDQAEIELP